MNVVERSSKALEEVLERSLFIMSEAMESCVKTAKGPILPESQKNLAATTEFKIAEEEKLIARVGKLAPDFEASAYQGGAFKNVKLSNFRGGWVVLCFYPGDFTFV